MKKLLCIAISFLFLLPAINGTTNEKNENNHFFNSSKEKLNHNPLALFKANEIDGKVVFDASQSYDPDGDKIYYRWDFNNDGIYDTNWLFSPKTTHVYYGVYDGFVKLQVRDEHGLTDECVVRVTIKNAASSPITGGIDQKQEQADGYVKIYGNFAYAQTFKPSKLLLNGIDIYVGRKGITSYESNNNLVSFLSERIRNIILKFFKSSSLVSSLGVRMKVNKHSSSAGIESIFLGDLVVNVWEVKDNNIQARYITGHTFKADEISKAGGWIHADFGNGIKLKPYKTYAIVVYQTGGNERNYYKWYYGNGDLYKNGMFYERINGGWSGDIGRDFCFHSYGELSGDEPDGIEEKWAVLIGVLNTSSGHVALYADKDAYDERDCLIAHGWEPSHIRVLISPTKKQVEEALEWMARNDDYDDLDVVTWTAHGGIGVHGEYAFGVYDSIIWGNEMDSYLDGCSYKGMLVVAETCHSGGVIPYAAQDGRVILASSSAHSGSGGWAKIKNSLFVGFLFDPSVGAFWMKSCDYNKDGYVSAEEAFRYAAEKTDEISWKYPQHPQISDGYPTLADNTEDLLISYVGK